MSKYHRIDKDQRRFSSCPNPNCKAEVEITAIKRGKCPECKQPFVVPLMMKGYPFLPKTPELQPRR